MPFASSAAALYSAGQNGYRQHTCQHYGTVYAYIFFPFLLAGEAAGWRYRNASGFQSGWVPAGGVGSWCFCCLYVCRMGLGTTGIDCIVSGRKRTGTGARTRGWCVSEWGIHVPGGYPLHPAGVWPGGQSFHSGCICTVQFAIQLSSLGRWFR